MTATRNLLQLFAGTWEGQEDVSATPWMPGGESRAKIRNAMPYGPNVLIQDYATKRNGEQWFAAHGVFVAGEGDDDFRLFWFDSFGFASRTEAKGHWNGTSLVFTRASERGRAIHAYTPLTDDSFHMLLESSADSDRVQKVLEATYTRVAA